MVRVRVRVEGCGFRVMVRDGGMGGVRVWV